MICEGMAAALLADTNLKSVWATLTGGSAASAQNVTPDELLPEGTLPPAVVMVEGDGEDVNPLRGNSELEWVTVDLECLARNRRDAGRLRVAVRQAVAAHLPGLQFGPFTVGTVVSMGRTNRYDPPAQGQDRGTYVATQRYRVALKKPSTF